MTSKLIHTYVLIINYYLRYCYMTLITANEEKNVKIFCNFYIHYQAIQ